VTLLLSDQDVRAACNVGAMVGTLEESLCKEASGAGSLLPARVNISHDGNFLRVMPALLPEVGLLGLKFFHGSMIDGVRYLVAVCSLETGAVTALLDGAYLTAARTGATSGVATGALSRPDSATVGLIGSGLEAETNLQAVCAVRPIVEVKVYSRSAIRRETFAQRMSDVLGIPVTPTSSPQVAVAGSDIVVVATNTGPDAVVAYQGAWLEAGQHVVSIGSTTAALREVDVDTFIGSSRVVFDAEFDQVSQESGDVMALLDNRPGWDSYVYLHQVISGAVPGRSRAEDITLFKSIGTAAQDMIAAMNVVARARELGLGRDVGDIASPKQF
jgi:alanine dehydrogenase